MRIFDRRVLADRRRMALQSRRHARRRLCAAELLESRRVLAGNISGTAYEDLDNDNVVDSGEGLSGWTVYADSNNNAVRDTSEPQSVSGSSGSYYLSGVTAGSAVVVRAIAPAGWQTVDASRTLALVDNAMVSGFNLRGALGDGVALLSGAIWHDVNGNGTRDSGETMNTSSTVYVDLDNDSVRDSNEPYAYASSTNGGTTLNYKLPVAQAGTYTVRQILYSPWQQVSPASNAGQSVTVTAGQRATVPDFIDRNPIATIYGTVFEDINGNALKEQGETLTLAGWRVYADLNDNGSPDSSEPSATTSSYGSYSLAVDTQGTLTSVAVRTVVPAGWVPTGDSNRRLVSSLKGGSFFSNVFGNQTGGGLVSGLVWNDTNADGSSTGEGVVAGRTVYADLDDDAALDADEPQATTLSDGKYQLLITTAGTFNVRQVVPTGWSQTSPAANAAQSVAVTLGTTGTPGTAGSRITGRNFGVRSTSFTLSGTVFDDADSNGSRGSTEALLSGWRVFADLNDNGAFDTAEPSSVTSSSGTYSVMLASLTTSSTVKFRVEIQAGWQATSPNPALRTLTVAPGVSVPNQSFGVKVQGRGIGGVVWNDADSDGVKGGSEAALIGWMVYIDANNNGVRDSTEASTYTGSDGSYVLPVPAAGDYTVRVMPMTNWVPTSPSNGVRTVTVGSTRVSGMDFGYRSTQAYVSGTVFDDANANGSVDLGEAGLAGWRVFADLNDNGLLDGGEPMATSSSSGAYSLSVIASTGSVTTKVRTQAATGWIATSPAGWVQTVTATVGQTASGRNFGSRPGGSLVSGFAWNDTDGDAVVDAGEYGSYGWTIFADANNNAILDAGESRTMTFSGVYQLVVPTAGSYTIRPVADAYWLSTAPAGGSYAVTVGSADRLTGRDFGRQAAIGFVSGTVFNDADGSGGMNGAETGLGGWRVFIDANGNGLLDSTEPSTTTSSSGGYFMSMTLSAQTVTATVRTQIQPGWLATSPVAGSQSVTITRGQTTSGRSFGVRNDSSVAVISGIAFNDANGNGVRETSDWPLSGRTIYVDADGDATLDADEIRTTTGTDGSYRIAFTSAGAYTLRQVLPSGFAQTTPASDAGIAVTVAVGDRAGGKDFGSRSALGSIAGFVFNDANANGTQDKGEAGLPSWRVYVDVDGDDTWDTNESSSLTSSSGSYYLNSVVATQTPAAVRTVMPTGWAATLPSAGEQAVTIVPGSTVSGRNFGNRSTVAAATGTVWNDTDADGVRDVGETVVSSRAIYVDANGNGAMDAEELRTYSAFDGTYRLMLPGAGTFTIRQLLPADWLQTSPGAGRTVVVAAVGDTSAGNDFASRFTRAWITGFVFNDVNSNGIVDTGEGTPNARVYADLDGDAAWDANEPSMVTSSSGTYWLMVSAIDPNDAAALSRSISVRTILPVGWGLVTPSTGTRSVTVTGGLTVTGQNFTTTLVGASVSGMAWNDANGDGSKGSSEAGISQLTVYVDGNGNGILDSAEIRTMTGLDGTYRLFVPTAGSYVIRQVASSAWVPTAPLPNAHSLTVVGGELFTGRDFGNRASYGTVSGVVYDDADQSGSRGTAEAGLAGWRIYADLDDDGVADATEPSTTTSSTGSYVLQISTIDARVRTIKLRTFVQAGWGATTPADGALAAVQVTGGQQTTAQDFGVRLTGAIVGGTVWNDLNGNGTRDSGDTAIPGRTVYADLDGDSVLDSNEPRAWTASDGNYQLVFNAVGTYTIRQMLPYYWVQTSPSGGHSVTVESLGTRTTGRDFGSRNTVASVSGAVFEDLDGDGIRDAGEVGLSGVRVYADTNNDGAFTTGEPSFVTSSTGSYYLTVPNLPSSATISIRQAAFAGLAATLPAAGARSLQIGGGQTTSGVNFGNRLTGAIVAGNVWHDLDSDGVRESGETSASGRTVYVDTNDNGLLDTSEARTTTLPDGSYQLMLTTAGTVKIRTVLPTGWQATLPALAAQTVAVTLGNRFVGNDFGTRLTTGTITGLVFNDLNGSGTQDAGESGLGGWIVFVDANNNGVWDTNEVRATTSSTGTYVLYGVTEGSTRVRLQLQVGWSFTTPGDGLLSPDVVAGTTTKAGVFGVRTPAA